MTICKFSALSAILIAVFLNAAVSAPAAAATNVAFTNFQGAWVATATYTPGDVVTSAGASYICIQTNTHVAPTRTAYWKILDAAGATGATGPAGPAGAAGPQGPAGTGVPSCTTPNIFLELKNAALVCQPRYVDNGDATVTDNQTGLMWEKKTVAGTGDVHDETNTYSWSTSTGDSSPDGTLNTTFLVTLNLDASSAGSSTCFANHCDWRIPTIVELQTILLGPYSCGTSPCIDPTFGPTQASVYWSSSSLAGTTNYAWGIDFNNGFVHQFNKGTSNYARAVRGGR
jgi:hypothetical protein